MAALVASVSETVTVIGGSPATQWGSGQPMTWGSSKWAYGSFTLGLRVTKGLSGIVEPTAAVLGFEVRKGLSGNSVAATSDVTVESLVDLAGWFTVFVRPTTNYISVDQTSFSSQAATFDGWTTATAATTSWSSST